MSKACLISTTSSLGSTMVTQSSGLNFLGGSGTFEAGLIKQLYSKLHSHPFIVNRIYNLKMRSKEIQQSNPRIRSFLSPYSRYGTRSLSSSDSCHTLNATIGIAKTYIDYKKTNRVNGQITNLTSNNNRKVNLEQYARKQFMKKDLKLTKCAAPRFQEQKAEKIDDNKDLLLIIRDLKEKVRVLQTQNEMLKQINLENNQKISKQDQIIMNLEEAIHITRNEVSYSVGSLAKSTKDGSFCESQKDDKENKLKEPKLFIQFEKLRQDNIGLMSKCESLTDQVEDLKIRLQQVQTIKETACTQAVNKSRPLPGIYKILNELENKKAKELQQIDVLLFGTFF